MHRIMSKLAKAMAILGGLVLVLLVAITCLSVLGRIANTIGFSGFMTNNLPSLAAFFKAFGPINGDYELVEVGIAFAIFAFLPWCQINRGHATVELFTSMFPKGANRFLTLLWELVFGLVILLITWRLYVGMTDKMRYGETTFLLQMPVWWAFAASTIAAIIASIVAIYSAWLHARELLTGEPIPAIDRSAGP